MPPVLRLPAHIHRLPVDVDERRMPRAGRVLLHRHQPAVGAGEVAEADLDGGPREVLRLGDDPHPSVDELPPGDRLLVGDLALVPLVGQGVVQARRVVRRDGHQPLVRRRLAGELLDRRGLLQGHRPVDHLRPQRRRHPGRGQRGGDPAGRPTRAVIRSASQPSNIDSCAYPPTSSRPSCRGGAVLRQHVRDLLRRVPRARADRSGQGRLPDRREIAAGDPPGGPSHPVGGTGRHRPQPPGRSESAAPSTGRSVRPSNPDDHALGAAGQASVPPGRMAAVGGARRQRWRSPRCTGSGSRTTRRGRDRRSCFAMPASPTGGCGPARSRRWPAAAGWSGSTGAATASPARALPTTRCTDLRAERGASGLSPRARTAEQIFAVVIIVLALFWATSNYAECSATALPTGSPVRLALPHRRARGQRDDAAVPDPAGSAGPAERVGRAKGRRVTIRTAAERVDRDAFVDFDVPGGELVHREATDLALPPGPEGGG